MTPAAVAALVALAAVALTSAVIGSIGVRWTRNTSDVLVASRTVGPVANGGATCEAPPGERHSTLGAMHLAYVRDPDGNKLCAIYRVK